MDRITNVHAHVYTEAGASVGTVTKIMDWSYREAIDGAGDWDMLVRAIPANEAILVEGYRCHIYGTIEGTEQELTIGYIAGISPTINREATNFLVTGEDRIGELRRRIIPALDIKEMAWTEMATLGSVRRLMLTSGSVQDDLLPLVIDGNPATHEGIEISIVHYGTFYRYTYVGFDARFDKIRIALFAANTASSANAMQAQYYSDSNGWTGLSIVDGTAVGGVTLKQSGDVTFTRPADWARCTPTASAGSWFWVRLYADNAQTTDVDVTSITVYADKPTTDGLNQIMAYAPTGWQTSGYAASATTAYFSLKGETVLQALELLREQIGGHYRANLVGGTMEIEWYDAFTASGITAGNAWPDATNVRATNIAPRTDLADLVTRIYPTDGDGNGLALTTRVAPAGYTLDAAANYIAYDASETAYGRHEKANTFSEVSSQQTDSYTQHPELAADALFDVALNYLKQNDVLANFYDISATGFSSRLRPGYTIHATVSAVVSGGTVVDIDETLNIVGMSHTIDAAKWLAAEIEITPLERPAQTDASVMAAGISGKSTSGGGGSGSIAGASRPAYSAGADIDISGSVVARKGTGVLLYSCGLTLLGEYAASGAGLVAALAAASTGGVVELPAGTIVGDVTVLAGVTLRGMGWKSSIVGMVTLGVGAGAEHLKVYQSVDTSDDIIGIIGPATGEATIRDVQVSLTQAGSGKALGLLSNGGILRAYECEVWVHGNASSAWGMAAATGGTIEMNQGQVKAWKDV